MPRILDPDYISRETHMHVQIFMTRPMFMLQERRRRLEAILSAEQPEALSAEESAHAGRHYALPRRQTDALGAQLARLHATSPLVFWNGRHTCLFSSL